MKKLSKLAPGVSLLALLMAAPAAAQDDPTPAAQSEDSDDEEIVVTGTSLRGVAPAGANVIGLNETDVAATGATDTAQLLATIPQVNDFGGLPFVIGVGPQQASNRPNLRGLSSGTAGGSPTLILMDGHRLAGAGVIQTVADPDVIPPGVIERVEVVTDGGSSVYGADAVGGVINFITRRDFDGVEINWREGFGADYRSTDAYLTLGKDWGSGSAYISYNRSEHDEVYGRDRDYARGIVHDLSSPLVGLGTSRSCTPGSVEVGGANFNIVNGAPQSTPATNASIYCDPTDDSTIYPAETRDTVFVGFSQDLTRSVTVDGRAWYTNRVTENDSGVIGNTISRNITPPAGASCTGADPATCNNFYQQIAGTLAGAEQTVYYNYGPTPGLSTIATAELETYGFAPSLTWDLGYDWQMRALVNYGHSLTTTSDAGINNVAVDANAANINFYNLAATDPAILAQLLDGNNQSGRGQDEILNGRIVFDGPTITLPAGEVRLAFGVEYLQEEYEGFNNQLSTPNFSDDRDATAFFGEINVPIVSPAMSMPLVHALNVNLSVRRDDYSDFGETTNPRVGVTYEPVDWVTIFGNWGTSFQAPSLADTAQTGSTVSSFPTFVLSGSLPFPGSFTDQLIAVQGAAPLVAQESESFSIGFDVRPPIIEGLTIGATYYDIEFEDQVGSPAVFVPTFFTDPSQAQFSVSNGGAPLTLGGGPPYTPGTVEAQLAAWGASDTQIAQVISGLGVDPVVLLIDFRRRNLAATQVTGIDGRLRYDLDTDWGTVFFTASGTYQLSRKEDPAGSGYGPNLSGAVGQPARWGGSATLGTTIGEHFLGQITWIHSDSQPIAPNAANAFQDEIGETDYVNLYLQYDVNGTGWGEDLRFSLGVNNVFDTDPPFFNGANFTSSGYVGGNLGRLFQIGVNKRF